MSMRGEIMSMLRCCNALYDRSAPIAAAHSSPMVVTLGNTQAVNQIHTDGSSCVSRRGRISDTSTISNLNRLQS